MPTNDYTVGKNGHLADKDGNTLGVYLPDPQFRYVVPLNPNMTDDWSGRIHKRPEYVWLYSEADNISRWEPFTEV